MSDLYRLSDMASQPFWVGAVEDMLEDEVLVPANIDYEVAVRQLVFDIIMNERSLDESDMDDQAEASEEVDGWMERFDAALGDTPDARRQAERERSYWSTTGGNDDSTG